MTEQTAAELGRFLRARRAAVTPAELGLPSGSGTRRTPGLRREELAAVAGVSIDYYIRLERGKETRPSPSVLDALARALRLDAEETAYLRNLAEQAARGMAADPRPAASRNVRPTLLRMLEAVRPCPAYVIGRTNDVLAANPGGTYLMPGMADWPARQRNTIRYTFLHPYARDLWPDWETKARACVAHLRAVVGSAPDTPDLVALVGELVVKSPDFSRMWERYDVRKVGYGQKTFIHPEVGTITLSHEVLEVVRTQDLRMVVYSAEPDTADYDAILLLDMKGTGALDGMSVQNRSPETGVETEIGTDIDAGIDASRASS